MLNLVQAFIAHTRDEKGQTFVEYALVIGGVSLLLLAAFVLLGPAVTTFVQQDIITKL